MFCQFGREFSLQPFTLRRMIEMKQRRDGLREQQFGQTAPVIIEEFLVDALEFQEDGQAS
jgi:hypothetical protein